VQHQQEASRHYQPLRNTARVSCYSPKAIVLQRTYEIKNKKMQTRAQ